MIRFKTLILVVACAGMQHFALAAESGPDSWSELVSDKLPHTKQAVARPAVLERLVDPSFKTTIVRITDVESGKDKVFKPVYSPMPAWNADESLMVLWKRGDGHYLFDGKSYKQLRKIKIAPADLEQIWWHPTDPDRLFYPTKKNSLMVYRPSTDKTEEFLLFPEYKKITFDSHRYGITWDGKKIAFWGQCQDGTGKWVILDVETKKKLVEKTAPQNKMIMLSPSGKYIVCGSEVYDADTFKLLRTLPFSKPEHGDLALWNGEDYMLRVQFNDAPNGFVRYNLSTGEVKTIFSDYPMSGTHISCIAFRQPGWIYISSIGYQADGVKPFDNELYMIKLDGSKILRLAHNRARGRSHGGGYFGEPQATVSPSGTRVAFASCWDNVDSGVNTYVVELPGYATNADAPFAPENPTHADAPVVSPTTNGR